MISWPNKYIFNKIIILWRKKNTQKIPDKENYYLQTNLKHFLQLPAKIYKISVDKPIIIYLCCLKMALSWIHSGDSNSKITNFSLGNPKQPKLLKPENILTKNKTNKSLNLKNQKSQPILYVGIYVDHL